MARLALACVALAAVALGATALAPASTRLEVGVTDDAWLMFGPGTVEERAQQLHDMGAEVVRVTLDWRRIEGQEGVFDWEREDAALDALRSQGIAPILVLWGTPAWANGGRAANVPPRSASDFAAFAQAAASRYSWVRRWISASWALRSSPERCSHCSRGSPWTSSAPDRLSDVW